MIRGFNAFQLVSFFAGLPFVIGWLNGGPFPYSTALMWSAVVAYLVLFVVLCVAVFNLVDG